ncbi:MAG: M14 family metallopeptidase [Planctomycetaceae bacterium]
MRRRVAALMGALFFCGAIGAGGAFRANAADLPFDLPVPMAEAASYSEAVPKPEDVIGHRIGTWHSEPHHLVEYFRAVAAKSDRVTLHEYARSHEKRPLIYAVVTSPANHARIDEIVAENRRLSDAPRDVTDEDLARQPIIVFQGYSVHGDEASGSEAAVLLLYHLAAGDGAAVSEMLDKVVLLIDPGLNPDGRHRFTTWANQNRGAAPVTDPANREHTQAWPGGRTNHYWFDLNRDWLPLRHPESRGRMKVLNHWRPQVVTDFHEMGSESHYFFQPGVPNRVNRNTPGANQQLTAEMAKHHAAALDRLGALYVTRERFDDFYPGKGSTYPDVTGAIGILFEQGASRALRRETEHGLLTYEFTVRNQISTSLSTMKAAVEMREKLLRHQRTFFLEAPTLARGSRVKAYLLSLEPDRTRAQELLRLMLDHRIHVHRLKGEARVAGAGTFRPESAVIVPVDQPQIRLLTAMMERQTEFDDDLFYDISTWTMPLAFGLHSAEYDDDPAELLGDRIESIELDGGRLVGGRARYAYLMRWNRYFAPRALHKLQEAGVRTRVITRPFSVDVAGESHDFGRGTILVTLEQRPPGGASPDVLHATIERIVKEDHVEVFALHGGAIPGGSDLGSTMHIRVLEKPEIALITGPTSGAYDIGEAWHLLSERFGIPVTLIDTDRVASTDLDRYDTLVLSGGTYSRLPAAKIREWVRGGGNLIAIGTATGWAIENDLVELKPIPFEIDELLKGTPHAGLPDARGVHQIGGAIFEATLDDTHPLAFGYGGKVPVFRNHTSFHEPASRLGTNVAVYADEPLLSGYISKERLKQIPGSAAIVATRVGDGRVALFMDNPNFRAFWYGTNGLFLNAIFFGGTY